jgi:hypothetical protein
LKAVLRLISMVWFVADWRLLLRPICKQVDLMG